MQVLHSHVIDGSKAKIEATKILKWSQARSFDLCQGKTKFLEIGQPGQVGEPFILNVDDLQKMVTEVQFLQIGEFSEVSQLIISIQLASRVGIPHGCR